jgi:hypothetical protein
MAGEVNIYQNPEICINDFEKRLKKLEIENLHDPR